MPGRYRRVVHQPRHMTCDAAARHRSSTYSRRRRSAVRSERRMQSEHVGEIAEPTPVHFTTPLGFRCTALQEERVRDTAELFQVWKWMCPTACQAHAYQP
jgi:hypothetical protein